MHAEPDDLSDDPPIRPRSSLPLMLFLAALLGGGGFLAWRLLNAPEPLRVLVAVELDGHWFEGSVPAARLADRLNETLESLGFETVRAGDPEIVATLERHADDPRAAARAVKAAWIVSGRLVSETIAHDLGDESGTYHEVRASGVIATRHLDDDTAGSEVPIEGWSGARDAERARALLAGDSLARQATAAAVPAILRHPALTEQLAGDARTVGRLQPAQKYSTALVRMNSTAERSYAALAKRRGETERGPSPVTYHGTLSADDGLCGAGPDGLLVKTENSIPFLSRTRLKTGRLELLETLEIRPVGGGPARVLWRGYNVFGYPGLSRDGRHAALSEDLFGWAKTVTLVSEGAPKRLALDAKKRFGTLKPSPDGKYVAFFERACRRCEDALVVLDAAGGERFRQSREGGSLGSFDWLDADTLLFLHEPSAAAMDALPTEVEIGRAEGGSRAEGASGAEGGSGTDGDGDATGEDGDDAAAAPGTTGKAAPVEARRLLADSQALWQVDLRATPAALTVRLVLPPDMRLSWLNVRTAASGPTGDPSSESGDPAIHQTTAVAAGGDPDGGPGLTLLDLRPNAADPFRSIGTSGRATAPRFSPDGRRVAFNVLPRGKGGDEEIAVLDVASGTVTVLTDNSVRDRYPFFGPDGRIYFESLDTDPVIPKRGVSVIASVAAP